MNSRNSRHDNAQPELTQPKAEAAEFTIIKTVADRMGHYSTTLAQKLHAEQRRTVLELSSE